MTPTRHTDRARLFLHSWGVIREALAATPDVLEKLTADLAEEFEIVERNGAEAIEWAKVERALLTGSVDR